METVANNTERDTKRMYWFKYNVENELYAREEFFGATDDNAAKLLVKAKVAELRQKGVNFSSKLVFYRQGFNQWKTVRIGTNN